MSEYMLMHTREFEKKVRKLAKSRGLVCSVDKQRGQGAHHMMKYGDKITTVPVSKNLKKGIIAKMLRDLGIDKKDL